MGKPHLENQRIADRLREAGDLLEQQKANSFRVNAFRRAAETVSRLDDDLRRIFDAEGEAGLIALPDIGRGIASSIIEILGTGRWSRLERLRGTLDPEKLFQSVPGIGAGLAVTIHNALHIDSLEGLESAAHDGRLEEVPGIGRRRAASIRASLANMLGRLPGSSSPLRSVPPVQVILDVDSEYRRRAAEGRLPTISPRRFNPDGSARLPILHADRLPWHFTALFSNTARAHELGRTEDWVVIYVYDDHHHEGHFTVVTETRGPLQGLRVIRGRETDCLRHYTKSE